MKKLRISLNILFVVCILSQFVSFADDSECVLLLYHRFSDEEPKSTSTSPKVFRSHLEYLIENDYKVLPLNDVVQRLKAQEKLKKEQSALIECQEEDYKKWNNCKINVHARKSR